MKISGPRKYWLILGALGGLIIGFFIGSKIESYLLSGSTGQWDRLSSPSRDAPITNILALDMGPYADSPISIYVETKDGKYFQGLVSNCQKLIEPCWISISGFEDISQVNIRNFCSSDLFVIRDPPYPIIQCVNFQGGVGGEFVRETHLALLEDGYIWVWEHSSGRMSLNSLKASALKCVVSPCIGFLIGLAIVLLFLSLSGHANNQLNKQTFENDG